MEEEETLRIYKKRSVFQTSEGNKLKTKYYLKWGADLDEFDSFEDCIEYISSYLEGFN